ncbi:hypothetical protein Tco_0783254, partial [Tanacetum coccineum]
MVLKNDVLEFKTTKENVKSLALKAKVTREQTSDDNDSQGGSGKDEDKDKEFNLIARDFRKFFRNGNHPGSENRFGNGGNRFGKDLDLQKENEELLKFNKHFTKTFENLLKEKCSLENERLKLFSKINELELEVKELAKAKE